MSNPFYKVPTWDLWPRYLRQVDAQGYHEAWWTAFDRLCRETVQASVTDVIRNETGLETMGEQALLIRSWLLGVVLPGTTVPLLRQYLSVAPDLLPYKGDYGVMEDAIFAFTGLKATVKVPWQAEEVWVFGEGEYGEVEVGPDFKERPSDAWVFGDSEYGEGVFGDDGEGLEVPFFVNICLQFDPGLDQIERVKAVAAYFKRAVDICRVLVPDEDVCWTIGTTVETTPELVERIVLPDLTTTTDLAMTTASVSEEGSRVGIDTRVCNPYWVFEEGEYGEVAVGPDPGPTLRIIQPDGTPVEDD